MQPNIFLSAIAFVRAYFRRTREEFRELNQTNQIQVLDDFVLSITVETNVENISSLSDIESLGNILGIDKGTFIEDYMKTLAFQLICYTNDEWKKLCLILGNATCMTYEIDMSLTNEITNLFIRRPWVVCVLLMRATDFRDFDENSGLALWKPKESSSQ